MLMVVFASLVVAHWFGFTASNIPESVQNSLLNIVMVRVGGYVMGRSAEKGVSKWQQKSANGHKSHIGRGTRQL